MNITYALGIAYNFDFEGFYNVIVNLLHMFLVDTPILPPHVLPLLEKELPLKVDSLILRKVIMYIILCGICLCPSP